MPNRGSVLDFQTLSVGLVKGICPIAPDVSRIRTLSAKGRKLNGQFVYAGTY